MNVWSGNGHYVASGAAMATVREVERQWPLCGKSSGNGHYVGSGAAMATMWEVKPQPLPRSFFQKRPAQIIYHCVNNAPHASVVTSHTSPTFLHGVAHFTPAATQQAVCVAHIILVHPTCCSVLPAGPPFNIASYCFAMLQFRNALTTFCWS